MRVMDLADLAGTTVRTIRYYHQLGLLSVPEGGTSWRSYGFSHLTRLMRIRWLVESGVPLVEVPHLLHPPGTDDERALVDEDLTAVLTSIEDRIAALTAQREQVRVLLERVRTHGGLSPLPPSVIRLYAALLGRELSPGVVQAASRERDLVELACYRSALPADLVALTDALTDRDVDELADLWEEAHQLDAAAGANPAAVDRDRIATIVRRAVVLAERVEPQATRRLLARAGDLDRPAVRAAIALAYRSPTYRQFVAAMAELVRDRRPA